MEEKTLDKGKLTFSGTEAVRAGTTTGLLKEAHQYAKEGWIVLFITDDEAALIDLKMEKNDIAPSDAVTINSVLPTEGWSRRVIQLCERKHPDVLIVDGMNPGVNDLRLLSEAAQNLNMLVRISRTKQKTPTGEMPLKGSRPTD